MLEKISAEPHHCGVVLDASDEVWACFCFNKDRFDKEGAIGPVVENAPKYEGAQKVIYLNADGAEVLWERDSSHQNK